MKLIVTGAAGFIGSNLVKALNARGVTDIVAVDNLTRAEKMPNLADCEIADYLDKEDFIERVRADEFDADVGAVLHQGACSDTMETDGRYMMENNYRYSLDLLDWCQRFDIPFIYASSASVYGAGRDLPRVARARGAAQRLRLLEVPLRPGGAPPPGPADGAGRGFPLLQRLRAARGAQGAHGLGGLPLLQPVPEGRARAPLRGQRRLRARASRCATS